MIREARASYVRQGSLGRHRANNGIICPRQSQPVFNGFAKRMPGTASVAQADQTPARVPKVGYPGARPRGTSGAGPVPGMTIWDRPMGRALRLVYGTV